METTTTQANSGKKLEIEVAGKQYIRLPIKTHVVTKDDDIVALVKKYAAPLLQKDDLLFISERVVAISQGRAFPIKDIKPSRLANLLVKFVHKSPYGIGLGSPWTMELALREAGRMRVVLAALGGGFLKIFGIRGAFYKLVGKNINAIDGPCDYTLPPYNEYAKLGPANPHGVAKQLAQELGHDVVIIDANDLGANILGKSNDAVDNRFYEQLFGDNPLGQTNEQTPMAVVRPQQEPEDKTS